jgi:methionyl-tRNA formyltransferase
MCFGANRQRWRVPVLKTIILLTGPVEQPVLGGILREHNPALTIHPVATPDELAAIAPKALRGARLIAFCTDVLVGAEMLAKLKHGAYNFHPGPPHFPGWSPAHFAILQRAEAFGATAHLMVEKVDAGPIVGIDLFAVPAGATVTSLEELTYLRLAQLFRRLAPALAKAEPLSELPVRWSGKKCTRAGYAALCAGRVA